MATSDPLRLGLIGAGVMGRHYADVLSRYHAADLRAVCDLDLERARRLGAEFGIPRVVAGADELLDRESLDAVVVATPDFAHRDPVLACFQHGVHVLCEKPLATTLEDCRAMIAASERAGKFLMVSYGNRHRPNARMIWGAVASGELGRIQHVSIRLNEKLAKTRTIAWLDRTSPVWFLLSHCVDLVRWILHDELDTVYALASEGAIARDHPGIPDAVVALAKTSTGTSVVLESAWNLPDSFVCNVDFAVEIIGEAGAMTADLFPHDLHCYTQKGEVLDHSFHVEGPLGNIVGWWADSVRYFVDACLAGRRPTPDGGDGLAVTSVLLALDRSIASGMPESAGPPPPGGAEPRQPKA